MIGDMAGSGPSFSFGGGGGFGTQNPHGANQFGLPGSIIRRVKVADNNSPLVRHRIYFNYNHFQNTFVDTNGNDFHTDRYTVGFEKPILNGRQSIEVRAPMFSTIDNNTVAGRNERYQQNFGNLSLIYKHYLGNAPTWALSAGLGVVVPSGPDDAFNNGLTLLELQNEAVHLQPFIAYFEQINPQLFVMGYVQMDFDANGNGVFSNGNQVGKFQDQNQLLVDLQIGRWWFQNQGRGVTGMATIFELHYNTSVQDSDLVTDGAAVITNPFNRSDVLNLTAALHFQLGQAGTLRVGAAAPISDGENRNFDTEFIVQWNRFYR